MREQQAARRGSTRERMAMGDDSYLPARDRGPVRKLVRDVVDARRNLARSSCRSRRYPRRLLRARPSPADYAV